MLQGRGGGSGGGGGVNLQTARPKHPMPGPFKWGTGGRGDTTSQESGQGIWGTWGLHLLALAWGTELQAAGSHLPCPLHWAFTELTKCPRPLSPLTDPSLPPPKKSQSPGKAGLLCRLPSW